MSTGDLFLIRHAMPVVRPDVPAHAWVLGDEGRQAARLLHAVLPASAYLVASDEAKAIETLEAVAEGAVAVDTDFGEVKRPNVWTDDHRAIAAAYVGGVAHAGWEPQALVVRRFDAAVSRHLAAATGRPLVIGTHGMAQTVWLASQMRLDPDPSSFWARLWFPDVIAVDLAGGKCQSIL